MAPSYEHVPLRTVAVGETFWLVDVHHNPILSDTYMRVLGGTPHTCWVRRRVVDAPESEHTAVLALPASTAVVVAVLEPAAVPLDPLIETFVSELRCQGVGSIEWLIYWYNDEATLEFGVVRHPDGSAYEKAIDEHVSVDCQSALYMLADLAGRGDSYGTFVLDVEARTVRHTGEAWMPEPEVQTSLFAPDRVTTFNL